MGIITIYNFFIYDWTLRSGPSIGTFFYAVRSPGHAGRFVTSVTFLKDKYLVILRNTRDILEILRVYALFRESRKENYENEGSKDTCSYFKWNVLFIYEKSSNSCTERVLKGEICQKFVLTLSCCGDDYDKFCCCS